MKTFAMAAFTMLFVSTSYAQERTLAALTTGNGHGFQIFDVTHHRIDAFLEHPYRFLSPNADPSKDGPERRNLSESMVFSISVGGVVHSFDRDAVVAPSDVGYLNQSHVITETGTIAGVRVTQNFFAPFGYEGNAMVAVLEAPTAVDSATLEFQMSRGETRLERLPLEFPVFAETGTDGGAMIYLPLVAGATVERDQTHLKVTSPLQAGAMAVAIQYVENANDAVLAGRRLQMFFHDVAPKDLVPQALAEFEAWRTNPPFVFRNEDERRVWRQGEAVLRMSQVREENRLGRYNHGMILASLPEGEWHISWVRDMTYSIVGLSRTGHFAEAKAALNFMLNAQPVGRFRSYLNNSDYRISVTRYFGDGSEEGDYSGESSPNIEIDGWGLFLWSARQYLEFSQDVAWLSEPTRDGSVYQAIARGVVQPIEENLEPSPTGRGKVMRPDASAWEVHIGNARHFAFTTMAAARGLCDAAAIAEMAGQASDQSHDQALALGFREGFNTAFVNPTGILGNLEKNSTDIIDGATLEAYSWNLIDDPASARGGLPSYEVLKTVSGGYRRVRGDSDYEAHEFIWIDFKMAEAMRSVGRVAEADALIATIVQHSKMNFDMIAEMYNSVTDDGPIGINYGSNPMVGYGPGVYAITLLDRDGQRMEPRSCGNGR